MTAELDKYLVPRGHPSYDRVSPVRDAAESRWIGRCKRCGATHRLEGVVAMGHRGGRSTLGITPTGTAIRGDYVIKADDGRVFMSADQGTNPTKVVVPCGDHFCTLTRVREGTKRSKHECGARCTSATGPQCDCRCKGKNHGADC